MTIHGFRPFTVFYCLLLISLGLLIYQIAARVREPLVGQPESANENEGEMGTRMRMRFLSALFRDDNENDIFIRSFRDENENDIFIRSFSG